MHKGLRMLDIKKILFVYNQTEGVKMKLKKIIAWILGLAGLLSITGCKTAGKTDSKGGNSEASQNYEQSAEENNEKSAESKTEDDSDSDENSENDGKFKPKKKFPGREMVVMYGVPSNFNKLKLEDEKPLTVEDIKKAGSEENGSETE